MKRSATLLVLLFGAMHLWADSGGPDQYGYLWKDSNDPNGPVYSWIDITATGIPITDLADDNVHGPYIMSGNMPYYWYDVKKVWVGSNGYVAFNGGNIAANFPALPAAGGTNNYVAAFMSDLTFSGAGNPAQCFLQDEATQLIISWINVPFWSVTAPGYTGSNTFQLILNKQDSTITVQYQSCTGVTTSNGPVIGIESITGDIGLARSQSLMPAAGYAVRFYNPPVPLLSVKDASVEWVDVPGTGGTTMAVGGSLPLAARVLNSGNVALPPFTLTSAVINALGQTVLSETVAVDGLQPGGNMDPALTQAFVPSAPGTYRHQVTLSGISGELVSVNNTLEREIVAYSPTAAVSNVSWAGPTDNGVGISWNGGDGGVAVYVMPPFQPCQITATTVRIASNLGSNFTLRVYDDDGPDGAPGTLLDSVMVQAANGGAGDHVYPLSTPIQSDSGGYYVLWYMQGPNATIAVDAMPPFSLRSYEVLGGAWAEYRDRTTQDFHLGLQVQQPPFLDVGVTGLVGLSNGQNVSGPVNVQVLVQNFGNTPASGFPVQYSFNGGPAVTQNYTGNNIAPGNGGLVTFSQPFTPPQEGSGQLCAWTAAGADTHFGNDSTCLVLNVVAAIAEQDARPLVLAPNPAADRVRVSGMPPGAFTYELLDARGGRAGRGTAATAGGAWELDVRELPPGSYVLRCVAAAGAWTGRVAVVR